MSDWDVFAGQLLEALRRFVQGDADPYKSLWSHRDDVTIFGGWGAYEQGWAEIEPRLDWAASRYSDGWLDQENLQHAMAQDVAYSVDIERSGGRFDNAPDVREASLRVTHLFRREEGRWRIVHRHARLPAASSRASLNRSRVYEGRVRPPGAAVPANLGIGE